MNTSVFSVAGAPSTGLRWTNSVIRTAWVHTSSSSKPSRVGPRVTRGAVIVGRVPGAVGARSPIWIRPDSDPVSRGDSGGGAPPSRPPRRGVCPPADMPAAATTAATKRGATRLWYDWRSGNVTKSDVLQWHERMKVGDAEVFALYKIDV